MQKRNVFLPILALSSCLAFTACSDDVNNLNAGTEITGTASEAATSSTTQAAALRPVFLHLLNDDGESISVLDGGVTDANGAYSLRLLSGAPGTRYAIEVQTETGSIYNFVTSGNVDVSPSTSGLYTIVGNIVGTPDGRSVDDYSSDEIDTLIVAAEAALTAASTDLLDADAIRAQLLTDIGKQIANSSEASISINVKPNPVANAPADVEVVGAANVNLSDGGSVVSETWDIGGTGSVSDGTNDSYDTFFTLTINGLSFPAQPGSIIQDDREVVYGPVVDMGTTGLDVTRKIYVDDVAAPISFARFLEILDNPTAADITVSVNISGNLGSDENNVNVAASSDGNTTADAGDQWLTNHQDSSDPAVGFLFPGADLAVKTDDDIDYSWSSVTVPAGGRVAIIHWGFQNTSDDLLASGITALLNNIAGDIPDNYFAGLSQQEVSDSIVAYFGIIAIGGSGSVTPGVIVTVTNSTTTVSADVTAGIDGSFASGVSLNSGDTVQVTATDGTDVTLVAP